jgi:hypothetical protein
LHPVKNSAIRRPWKIHTIPLGEYPGALRRNVRIPVQRQHAHGYILVVHYFPSRCLANQFLQGGLERDRYFCHDLTFGPAELAPEQLFPAFQISGF